ncbi:helix-turn-helix domain-containing protein [Streptomyces werraensis]|uniref:helix-turn-helix domain-containing protein n=1 Tax=Streptomyces werraensis TaxID=68284 RepID=UPI0036FCBF8A
MQRHEYQDPRIRDGYLQSWLLEEKRRSGLSFGELAALTFVSKSSLQRATQGSELPSRSVFEAFVRGCASDPDVAEGVWQMAIMMKHVISGQKVSLTNPGDVTNHTNLREALAHLVRQKRLTLRQIERLAENRGAKLRRSTLSDSLSGRQKFSRDSVRELVRSCGEADNLVQAWDEAWQRAEGERRGREGHLGGMRKLPAEVRQYVELGVDEIFRVCCRYGISSAEVDMYIRQRAELRRSTGIQSYWIEAPESWKVSVAQPCGDMSGRIERAVREVLLDHFGGPLNGSLAAGLTKAVLEEISQSETVDTIDDSGTPD